MMIGVMKSTRFGAIVVVAWMWTVVAGALHPVCDHLAIRLNRCFSDQGLTAHIPAGQENFFKAFLQLQQMEVGTYCNKLQEAKKAVSCGMPLLHQCMQVLKMDSIVPDVHRVLQGMDAFCRRPDISEFNSTCLTDQMPSVLQCGQNITMQVNQGNKQGLTMEEIVCLTADINYDCYKLHLQTCNPTTQNIYLESMNKYFIPPVCVDRPPGRPGRKSYTMAASSASASVLSLGVSIVSLLLHIVLRP